MDFQGGIGRDVADVVTTDGAPLALGSMAHSLGYNADGSIAYVQVANGARTYRQTFTYTSGKLSGISGWVEQ